MLLLMTTLFACSNDEQALEQGTEKTTSSVAQKNLNGQIPFTVENVQEALANVLAHYDETKPDVANRFRNYNVVPTHVYYKFTPADSLQYSLLMDQEDVLNLTTNPLEHNIVEKTQDPSDDEIPAFYAVVSTEQSLPDVPHEQVAVLHFTNEDNLEDAEHNYDEIEFKQNLMYEARKLAGHLDDQQIAAGYWNIWADQPQDGQAAKGLFPKKWRPSGSIRVEEDIVRRVNPNRNHSEPVKQARVNVLKWGWLQVEKGTTDGNGNFSTGTTYTKHVHYVVKFYHDKTTVKEGKFYDIASYFSSEHNRAPLNITFLRDGALSHYHFFALVHNASYDYYNRCLSQYGLYNPTKLNITALYNGSGSNAGPQWIPFNSAIRISRSGGAGYRGSDGIYSTTVHELTHAGHRKLDPGMFSFLHHGNKERLLMKESWADGVETILTDDRYNAMFTANNYGTYRSTNSWNQVAAIRTWNGFKQNQTQAQMNAYTPLVVDLIDNFNQRVELGFGDLPRDRVTGYNLGEIQSALNTSRTLDEWKNRLLGNFVNHTGPFIDDVFDYAKFSMHNSQNWPD